VNVSSNLSRHQVDKLQHPASVFSLNNRGRKLYLTQIYYSVFDQSEQGLPRCSLLSVLLTGCFLLSSPCPGRHDGNCLLELSIQEDRALSE